MASYSVNPIETYERLLEIVQAKYGMTKTEANHHIIDCLDKIHSDSVIRAWLSSD